ncbi:MAG: hypothetical protein CMI63_20255 [Parvularcula sp.]|nr:hypothetical protein [Parvularcula sp.]
MWAVPVIGESCFPVPDIRRITKAGEPAGSGSGSQAGAAQMRPFLLLALSGLPGRRGPAGGAAGVKFLERLAFFAALPKNPS